MQGQDLQYAGFWIRTWASIIDAVLLLLITGPILVSIYGWEYFNGEDIIAGPADFLVSWVLPAIGTILFWAYRQATPGKMLISAKVVDATSGGVPSLGQLVGRYLAYFVALIPLGLGFFWVAFDRKKQGWHDKLAGTVVIRRARSTPEPVTFIQAREGQQP